MFIMHHGNGMEKKKRTKKAWIAALGVKIAVRVCICVFDFGVCLNEKGACVENMCVW